MAATDFMNSVPGFEFLQGLAKNAGVAMPGIGQWVAPTLDPQELERRIGELRTVQFWLEQNARLMSNMIQALEVQRMTLATLQGMNLPLAGLRDATAAASAPATAPAVDPMQWWSALTQQFTELASQALRDGAAKAAPSDPAATPTTPAKPARRATPSRRS